MEMQVAQTILSQLGGRRFIAMTGASNFIGGADNLSFKVGRNAKGVTHVRVTLTPMDVYTVEFLRVRNMQVKEVSKSEDVYNDMLREVFERNTGLRTSL